MTIEETERFRVRIELDPYPDEPDSDGTGHVILIRQGGCRQSHCENWHYDVKHADYSRGVEASVLAIALTNALDRHALDGADWELAERYLRAFYGVVSFDRIDWGGDTLVCVVTKELADAWGCPEDKRADAATSGLAEWRAYGEGDVYGYVIEERAHWRRTDAGHEDEEREDWQEVDSCWGYYGYEWAEESARDALASYAK